MLARRDVVLYDGDCGFCSRWMVWVKRLDWLGRFDLLSLHSPLAGLAAPGISSADLMEAMHCITPGGVVYRGAHAVRHIALRLPLGIPLGLLLWIPGIMPLAEKGYAMVSRRRHGSVEACHLP
jgi:predicted DCC family thiol-disulfide oxidoreductase YuxK